MDIAEPEDRIDLLEAQGFAVANVECLQQRRERRAQRIEPPASEAELEEYRKMLPTLRWLHENREAVQRFIEKERPAVMAGCPMYRRLSGEE